MEKKKDREIISRRARPAKAPLSRELIVTTALSLVEKEGLAGLSLRKVAIALDTGPASLYVYVDNLADLYGLMLDQAMGAIVPPAPDQGSWRERTMALLRSYLDVLQSHPGLAHLAMATISTGRNSLRLLELLLALLIEGGADEQSAAWGVDMLSLFVTAIGVEEVNRNRLGEQVGRVRRELAELEAGEFPLISRMQGALLAGEGPDRLDWALNVLLDGIVARRTAESAPGTA